jgi:hypothetical protein
VDIWNLETHLNSVPKTSPSAKITKHTKTSKGKNKNHHIQLTNTSEKLKIIQKSERDIKITIPEVFKEIMEGIHR